MFTLRLTFVDRPLMLFVQLLAALLVYTVTYDVLSKLVLPKRLQRLTRRVTSPFRNFLTVEDIDGPVSEPSHLPLFTSRVLTSAACLQAFGWFSALLYGVILHDTSLTLSSATFAASWVKFMTSCQH